MSKCILCGGDIQSTDLIRETTSGAVSGDAHSLCWHNRWILEHLPPFSGVERTCPKCHSGIDTTYRTFKVPESDPTYGQRHECLERSCVRCGYHWRERCADE